MLMQPVQKQDPLFPKLADALDPVRAGYAFKIMLSEAGFPVRKINCSIERARLKLGRKALLGYRLTGEAESGESFDQSAMLILWPDGEAHSLPDMGGKLEPPDFGPSRAPVDHLMGDAWLFPNDRKVHHIGALLDETPAGIPSDGVTREVLHYVPEQGCAVRLTTTDGQVFYGKCRTDDRGSISAKVSAAALDQGHPDLRLATVIDHDPERHILWQTHVSGQPLNAADVCARAGRWAGPASRAINAFHAFTPPDGLKELTVDSIAQTLARRIERSKAAMPALAAEIEMIGKKLMANQPADRQKLVLSHCDLHPANLLWDGVSFAMIDLDTAALAPRALDYGSLVASLVHGAVEAQARDNKIDAMIAAFCDAASDESGDGLTIKWFVAASLIGERLYRCGTRMKSPALRSRTRLIEIADRLLQSQGGIHV